MKLFISWSGDTSKDVASALAPWLKDVIQTVEPWVSSRNIQAGQRWSNVLQQELREAEFGIVCVTNDNLHSPWLLFEAGALANSVSEARVVPYLFGPMTQVLPPLGD